MIELITVIVILALVVIAWFALCMNEREIKEALTMAIGVPVMIITVLSIVVWVIYSFGKVFGGM